jgi:hypothetical protein
MKWLVAASLALGGAILLSGCGGGAGPASPSFDPFGSEPTGSSAEKPGTPDEGSSGAAKIDTLCSVACGRIMAACPAPPGSNCVVSCESEFQAYPACAAQGQMYLSCIAESPISCSGYGSLEVQACRGFELVFQHCIEPYIPPGS